MRRHLAFTLLEVVLAFMILSIGVFVIVAVFPRGYDAYMESVLYDDGRIYVQRLSDGLVDYKCDGIIPAGGVIADVNRSLANYSPVDMSAVISNNDDWFTNFYFPNMDGILGWLQNQPLSPRIMRRVIGEKMTIPADFSVNPSEAKTGYHAIAPMLSVMFAPMQIDEKNSLVIYDLPYKKVNREELTALIYSTADYPNKITDLEHEIAIAATEDERNKLKHNLEKIKAEREIVENKLYYYVDYSTSTIYFIPLERDRNIRIQYSYITADGRISKTYPSIEKINANSTHIKLPESTVIVPQSEIIERAYTYIDIDEEDEDDVLNKYTLKSGEYYLDTSNIIITGYIYFSQNDLGKDVNVDYTVADWAIISEDIKVNESGDLTFSLSPQLYKLRNDTMALNKLLTANEDIVMSMIDLSTGRTYDFKINGNIERPRNWTSSGYTLSATRNDTVYRLVANAGTPRANLREFRVFYRANRYRMVQYFRPPSLFYYIPPTEEEIGDPDFVLPDKELPFDSYSYTGNYLALSAIYEKQKITVDYQYLDENSRVIAVDGEIHTVPDSGYGKVISIIKLRHAPIPGTIPIVKGTNAFVRTIWRTPSTGPMSLLQYNNTVMLNDRKTMFTWASWVTGIGVRE